MPSLRKTPETSAADAALPARAESIPTAAARFTSGRPPKDLRPAGLETAIPAMGRLAKSLIGLAADRGVDAR
jgi:hypothetical protein